MIDHIKLLSSLSVGSWYQNVAFYAFVIFFIYLNLDIISNKEQTGVQAFKMNKPSFTDNPDVRSSAKY